MREIEDTGICAWLREARRCRISMIYEIKSPNEVA